MNLKGLLELSTGLMAICVGLIPPFAHAQVNNIEAAHVNVIDNYKLTDGSVVKRTLVKLAPDSNSSPSLGREVVQIGGDYAKFGSTNVAIPMSLSVLGRPYGNFNAGCTLCIFSSDSGMYEGGGQAAISGLDAHSGANAVAGGDLVTVGFYQYDENSPARVVAQAASFGPGVVTLSSPMSDAQMSQLKEGMYIATNVIDPNLVEKEDFLRFKAYWGYIKSWDATHIYVYDWAVQGGGNSAAGQVPNIQHLENKLLAYKVPMIFAGVANKVFAKNEFMFADGRRVLGDKATAVANQFEREEFDFRAQDWTKPYSLAFHGWTTSLQCNNCNTNAFSEDSYAYLVNGANGLPRAYIAQTVGDALEFSGFSTMLPGNGAPQHVDVNGNISDAIVGSNHIMSSFESGLSSNNKIHMSTIINRDAVLNNDWHDYSVRLVMDVDSKRDRRAGLAGGSRMGSIAFNYNAEHYRGICLLGGDTNQGLCQEGDGTVNFAENVSLNNNTYVAPGKLISFKNDNNLHAVYLYTQKSYTNKQTGKQDIRGDLMIGTRVSGGGSIRGVNGYYGKSVMVSGQVAAASFKGKLSTPSSSSAPCSVGEFKDDANYHYVCVSQNKWKRVALSDF